MIYVHRFQSERDSHGTSTSSSPVRGRQPYRPRPSSPRAQTPIQTPSPAPPASEADSMSLPPERQLPPPRLQVISIQRRPHLRPRAPGQSSLRRPVLPTPSHSDYDVSASTLLAGAESVDATRPESQAASPLRAQGVRTVETPPAHCLCFSEPFIDTSSNSVSRDRRGRRRVTSASRR